MATQNVGRVKPIFRGEYDPNTPYRILDFVRYENKVWTPNEPVQGVAPGPTASQWDIVVDGADVSGSVVTTSTGTQTVAGALDSRVSIDTNTYLIPTDFPNMQTALDTLSSTSNRNKERAIVRFESGYVITEGWECIDANLGHVEIQSEDAEVLVAPDVVMIPNPYGGGIQTSVINYSGGAAPILGCVINVNDITKNGLAAYNNCYVKVLAGCGVQGGRYNAELRGVVINAQDTVWDTAGRVCLRCTSGTRGTIVGSFFRGGWMAGSDTGTPIDASSALHISRGCIINAGRVTVTGSGASGVTVRRSFANLANAVTSDNFGVGLVAGWGAHVAAPTFTALNNGSFDIRAVNGGGAFVFVGAGSNYGTTQPSVNTYNKTGGILDSDKDVIVGDSSAGYMLLGDGYVREWYTGLVDFSGYAAGDRLRVDGSPNVNSQLSWEYYTSATFGFLSTPSPAVRAIARNMYVVFQESASPPRWSLLSDGTTVASEQVMVRFFVEGKIAES